MRNTVIVVGSGGREHSQCWKLAQSLHVGRVLFVPGNAGWPDQYRRNIAADDIVGLVNLAKEESVALVVAGSETSLFVGLGDVMRQHGINFFGPNRAAAKLEESKRFMKELLVTYGIPTAKHNVYGTPADAEAAVRRLEFPVVMKPWKANLGKGVEVCHTMDQALAWVQAVMKDRIFGEAGAFALLEEFLPGEEISFITLTDGENVVPGGAARDYKMSHEGDTGKNCGSMGSTAQAARLGQAMTDRIMKTIMVPTVEAMAEEEIPFQGFLYGGLKLTPDGPKVLEFNVRGGDSEEQVLQLIRRGDLFEYMMACATIGGLRGMSAMQFSDETVVCTNVVSGPYPDPYKKGYVISGIGEAARLGCQVFHAGTEWNEKRELVTHGGRVQNILARDRNPAKAVERSQAGAACIKFTDARYRKDIGAELL